MTIIQKTKNLIITSYLVLGFLIMLWPLKAEGQNASTNSLETNFIDGHEYVDLGLPSGLKWATCNLGASSPEEYGDYFPWGGTRAASSDSIFHVGTYRRGIYWLLENEFIDEDGNLTLANDAASKNWGASWRMPTNDELKELLENTTPEWTTINDVSGCLLTSVINGESIFLPAAGNRSDMINIETGSRLFYVGIDGGYWSSTPFKKNSEVAHSICFNSDGLRLCQCYRDEGRPIRAVTN